MKCVRRDGAIGNLLRRLDNAVIADELSNYHKHKFSSQVSQIGIRVCTEPFQPDCRSLARTSTQPLHPNWRSLPHLTREKFMRLASVHASTSEKLNLRRFWQLKSEDVTSLCQNLPQLMGLSIAPRTPPRSPHEFHLKPVIELIANHLPSQLVNLDIHIDQFTATFLDFGLDCVIDDNMLRGLYQRYPNLQKLNLCTSTITPHGLNGLVEACQSLTSLDLKSPELGWPEIAKVFTSCRSLCHFSSDSEKLTSPPWRTSFEDNQEMNTLSGEQSEEQEEMDSCFYERGRRTGAREVGQDGAGLLHLRGSLLGVWCPSI